MFWMRIGLVIAMIATIITGSGEVDKNLAEKMFPSGSFERLVQLVREVQNQRSAEDLSEDTGLWIITAPEKNTEENYVTEIDDEVEKEQTTEPFEPETKQEITVREEKEQPTMTPETEVVQVPKEPEPVHVHVWKSITENVHHDAVTEEKWVVDQAAWTEEKVSEVPIVEQVFIRVATCRGCGSAFEDEDLDVAVSSCHWHIIQEHDNSCGYGLENSYYISRQVGLQQVTENIEHAEVGHIETVTIRAAYDETVITGYKCECGATK